MDFLLLGVYAMAPLTFIAWVLALGLFYEGVAPLHGVIVLSGVHYLRCNREFRRFF